MSEEIRKHEYLEENEFSTLISEDVRFEGVIESHETMLVKGTITNSKIHATLMVIVADGKVEGDVSADIVSVLGECRGDFNVGRSLHVSRGGAMYGKVCTQSLVVEEGSLFNCSCTMYEPPMDNQLS